MLTLIGSDRSDEKASQCQLDFMGFKAINTPRTLDLDPKTVRSHFKLADLVSSYPALAERFPDEARRNLDVSFIAGNGDLRHSIQILEVNNGDS